MRIKILKDDSEVGVKAGEEYDARAYWLDPQEKITLYRVGTSVRVCNLYRSGRGTIWEKVGRGTPQEPPLATEHVAGPMKDWVQLCTRCGATLSDYRNAAWPSDQKPPSGFQPGATVRVEAAQRRGGFVVTETSTGSDERPAQICGPKN